MSYYVNANFSVENHIEITFIENPHKFWFKYSNDESQIRLLQQLESGIEKHMRDLFEWGEQLLPISYGDVVATNHVEGKWIRGKAGKLQKGTNNLIKIWAIDYGREMLLPLSSVFLLKDQELACRHPINVHIGGLSGVSPANAVINLESLETDVIKVDSWSPKATEHFQEWIGDNKRTTFHKSTTQAGRSFGRVFVHCAKDTNTFCVAQGLCDIHKLAILNKDYLSDVRLLSREDFLRLNHEMAFWKQDEIELDDSANQIWMNDDALSSIDLQFECEQQEVASQSHNSKRFAKLLAPSPTSQAADEGSSIDLQLESASQFAPSSRNRQSTHSSTQQLSSVAESSLSTVSVTLSVKTLNKLNVLVVTDDEVVPTQNWSDAFFFSNPMISCLSQLLPHGITPQCSYCWPHIMRGNSMFLIGETNRNLLLCLPTVCSVVHSFASDWETSVRIEPFAIIFVPNANEVEHVSRLCHKLLQKSSMSDINVVCLNSSFEIGFLDRADKIDILVTSVFCFETVIQHKPKLFDSQRLRYIWFHQIDEMCEINDNITYKAINHFLSSGRSHQVVTTSQNYCAILSDLFFRVGMPMLSIGDRSPFEAALFAKCYFKAEFLEKAAKIQDLIAKLNDPNTGLSGSIVIMCANKKDVKHAIGHLTQANIRCTEFDEFYSGNQMKLVNWSKRCLSMRNPGNRMNILVCTDENLGNFPIRTATHIVHYSLPNTLKMFKQRYITCYGFYADRLLCKLVDKQEDYNLQRPLSLVYFDDGYSNDYVNIYELLLDRTECEFPVHLTHTVEQLRYSMEEYKTTLPVCPELITKAKGCGVNCPYRHVISNPIEPMIPEYGLVNMELLEIIAPNHFSVRIIAHKRSKEHRSKPIANDDEKWLQFERDMSDYYTTERRENNRTPGIGEMCLIFHKNQPKRCRVLSKSKTTVSVYLIDVGRICNYSVNDLYHLDNEFQYFPSRAIEVFVLGYKPSDCNPNWLPEAKQLVAKLTKPIKGRETEKYLQAEIINAFERTLIVKDLNIVYKQNGQHLIKNVGNNLIKYRFADKSQIVLHYVFRDEDDNSDRSSESYQSSMSDEITIRKENKLVIGEPSTTNSEDYSLDSDKEPAAPANSVVSFDNENADLIAIDQIV